MIDKQAPLELEFALDVNTSSSVSVIFAIFLNSLSIISIYY